MASGWNLPQNTGASLAKSPATATSRPAAMFACIHSMAAWRSGSISTRVVSSAGLSPSKVAIVPRLVKYVIALASGIGTLVAPDGRPS